MNEYNFNLEEIPFYIEVLALTEGEYRDESELENRIRGVISSEAFVKNTMNFGYFTGAIVRDGLSVRVTNEYQMIEYGLVKISYTYQ